MNSVIRVLQGVNQRLCRWGMWFAGALLAIMLAFIAVQVVGRYVFSAGFGWTEELAKIMMVWTAFCVAPAALRDGQMVAINFFPERIDPWLRRTVNTAVQAALLICCLIFIGQGIDFVGRGMDARAATVPIQTGYFYVIVPISFGAMALVCLEKLFLSLQRGKGETPCP